MFEEKVNKVYINKKYIAAGQVWWVDMQEEETSEYKFEETTKTRLWLVLSSNAEAAFCIPFTHRLNRNVTEPVITDGTETKNIAMKGGYLRRLSIDRFTEPGSSLYYTLSRRSLKKIWSVVMCALIADEFEEDEMHSIIRDAYIYDNNAHRNNVHDKWVQGISCHMGDIYSSNINMNEEAIAREKYMNGKGYEIDNTIPYYYQNYGGMSNGCNTYTEPEREASETEGQGDDRACEEYDYAPNDL